MNQDEMRAASIKLMRREVLRSLNFAYPGVLDFEMLIETLLLFDPDPECVQKDLAYLVDKGYVLQVNAGEGWVPWARRVFKLTTLGNEIANKITTDKALEP